MRLKFITLNLWIGGMLFDNILDFLKKENPDILVCQEVFGGKNKKLERRFRSFDFLKKEFKFKYASFAPTWRENLGKDGMVERGNAIFSRFPVIKTKTVFFDVPYNSNFKLPTANFSFSPRNMQSAVVKKNGIELNVFNTQGIWGFDGQDNKRRLKMAETIIKQIKDKKNVILAGDFNVNQGTKTIASIGKYLKEIFKGELNSTFNIKRKPKLSGYGKAVVDRIFVSKNINVLKHCCPKVDISDHLPLVGVFET